MASSTVVSTDINATVLEMLVDSGSMGRCLESDILL